METFRRLLPTPADGLSAEDVALEVPGPPPAGRPYVFVNMIATADGRATVEGRTAPIANRADYELFHALRARSDAVMVGAETIRVEGYGPMEQLAVVVSRRVELPTESGLLAAPENRVVIVTPSPGAELPPCAASVSYLRGPDLAAALRRLRDEHGWLDAFRALHGYEHREASWTFAQDRGGWRLDHVLVHGLTPTAAAYAHEWRRNGLSDHAALIVDLRRPG